MYFEYDVLILILKNKGYIFIFLSLLEQIVSFRIAKSVTAYKMKMFMNILEHIFLMSVSNSLLFVCIIKFFFLLSLGQD